MGLFSVPDWSKGCWRVYSHPSDTGLYDPVIEPKSGSQRVGLALEDAVISLPFGAKFVGLSQLCMGRAACDSTLRSQSRAQLPSGVGAIEGTGGLGAVEAQDVVWYGGATVLAAWGLWALSKVKTKAGKARATREMADRLAVFSRSAWLLTFASLGVGGVLIYRAVRKKRLDETTARLRAEDQRRATERIIRGNPGGSINGLGAIAFTPRTALVIGLAFAGGLAIAWGLAKRGNRKKSRRRNAAGDKYEWFSVRKEDASGRKKYLGVVRLLVESKSRGFAASIDNAGPALVAAGMLPEGEWYGGEGDGDHRHFLQSYWSKPAPPAGVYDPVTARFKSTPVTQRGHWLWFSKIAPGRAQAQQGRRKA